MGERATIVGTNAPERLVGTNDKDVIVAKGGNDYIKAKASGDLVCAGAGRDHIATGNGRDEVNAGAGADSLVAGERTVLLAGGVGDDVFFTRGGVGGRIRGGPGSDWLSFVDRTCKKPAKVFLKEHEARYRNCAGTRTRIWSVRGIANVEGGRGSDILVGSDHTNRLIGHERGDRLEGGGGRDRAYGGDGGDVLRGDEDNDRLYGGARYDRGRGGRGRDRCIEIEAHKSC